MLNISYFTSLMVAMIPCFFVGLKIFHWKDHATFKLKHRIQEMRYFCAKNISIYSEKYVELSQVLRLEVELI